MEEKKREKLLLAAKSTAVNDIWCRLSLRKIALLPLLLVAFLICDVCYVYNHTNVNVTVFSHSKVGISKLVKNAPQRITQETEKEHRLPKCILIGAAKGGTRALVEYLDHLHPDVVAYIGEVNFFDRDSKYRKGLDYYRSLMPLSFENQITIEKTPMYFNTEKVPRRVYQMNSSIKLLLTVRNPVERTVSEFTMVWIKGKRVIPFQTEIFDDHGNVNRTSRYVMRSIYHEHLTRWLQYFPREQIHIVDGEKLVKDPYDELFKIETFLEIGHKISQRSIQFNKAKGFYCMVVSNETKCLSSNKGLDHIDVPETQLEKLRRYFKPLNERFYEVAGVRFDWQ